MKDLLCALSIAQLWLWREWLNFFPLRYDSDYEYFLPAPPLRAYVSALLLTLSLGSLLFLCLRFSRRSTTRPGQLLFPWLVLGLALYPWLAELISTRQGLPALVTLTLAVLMALSAWRPSMAGSFGYHLGLVSCPLLVMNCAQIAWHSMHEHVSGLKAHPAVVGSSSASPRKATLLWILFDEMDYDVAVTRRPPGLTLPHFDRLRESSLYAEQAYSPAACTLLSMPSYLVGRLFTDAETNGASELTLTEAHTEKEYAWNARDTLFASARTQGSTTAMVGFFHPYCRLLAGTVESCSDFSAYQYAYPSSLGAIMAQMVRATTLAAASSLSAVIQLRNHELALAKAKELIESGAASFVFVHLAVPRPPRIFDSQRNALAPLGGEGEADYLENLRLADKSLGEILATAEGTTSWKDASIIFTSDHGRRISTSGEKRPSPDPAQHIPFLVRLAGGSAPVIYPRAFNTVIGNRLAIEILDGRLASHDNVREWLDLHATAEFPKTDSENEFCKVAH